MKTTVLIADDHKLLRETISLIINNHSDYEVIASCGDSQEAIEIARMEKPAIVLMDINMTPVSGMEATKQIKQFSPLSKVIGMTVHSDPAYAKKMLKMGASGYVTKNSPKDEMFKAMAKVMNGEMYICHEIKDMLCEQLTADPAVIPGLHLLTERETQIIQFIKNGRSSKEIAAAIRIATKTVEVHRHNILQKLKLKNSPSLINYIYSQAAYLI